MARTHRNSTISVTWAAVVTATGLVVGGGTAGADPAPTPAGSVTVTGALGRIVVDGREDRAGHARGETRAYLTIDRTPVPIDAALASTVRSGPVDVTVTGTDVAGRTSQDIADQVRQGSAKISGLRDAGAQRAEDVLGTHHAVIVPVYWTGSEETPTNGPAATAYASTYWSDNTFGKVKLVVDKAYSPVKITPSADAIANCDAEALFREVEDAIPAQPSGVKNHIIGVLPYTSTCYWSGVASLGAHADPITGTTKGAIFLVNGGVAGQTYAHEFGHNLYLMHGGALTCWTDAAHTAIVPVSDYCEQETYNDPWDIMGNRAAGALAAGNRWRLGVIPDSGRQTVTGDDTVTLAPVAAASGTRSVVFYNGPWRYEMEYRTPTGYDDWINNNTTTLPDGTVATVPGGGVIVRQFYLPDTEVSEYDVVDFHASGSLVPRDHHPGLDAGDSYTFPGGMRITVESATSSGATVSFRRTIEPGVTRWYGEDRYETSATISRNGFYDATGKVFLASGSIFTDALSGAGVASWARGPLLLVKRDTLTRPIAQEMDRLTAFDTTIFGGPASISEDTASVLSYYGDVRRLAGADRYATSAAISKDSFDPSVSVAYVASGLVFPDALSGAPVAGKNKAPMLLTTPDTLPSVISAELRRVRPKSVVVLGGPASVSDAVLAQIKSVTGVTPSRVSGADRYAVSALISQQNFSSGSDLVFVASGEIFTDALSGAPVAGSRKAPLLLVRNDSIPAAVHTELRRLHPKTIVILGGPASVSSGVAADLEDYLD